MPRTLPELSKKMRDIDFAMLISQTEGKAISGRPMSNNREVGFDGDAWFFADGSTRMVGDIANNPNVGLSYQGEAGFLGMRPLFIHVEGVAELLRDHAEFEKHWTKDLERWWPDGIDTPGLVLIRITGSRIHYWDGEDQGDIHLV
ncbi:pyridoxamine 5'-phosphate oxidase family protein [Novosphingobium kaempferiae]|uniref:pyridoxamine 5'-phosphate oxidase family protein n=1 Tax=Novosphingobium kaempferiae TaxID=2896849 RepID=UPI001E5095E5|nr:pyridoxamine 5'-phosphate oxidase family protein [Novosphingobium kaempferiae]